MSGQPVQPDRVIAAYEGRRRTLQALLALQGEQREALERDDAEALLEAISRRQAVIDSLAGQDDDLREADRLFDAWAPTADPALRGRAEDLRRQARELAAGLEALDAEDQERLRRRADELSREMSSMTTAQRASGAYGSAPAAGARYQDRSA